MTELKWRPWDDKSGKVVRIGPALLTYDETEELFKKHEQFITIENELYLLGYNAIADNYHAHLLYKNDDPFLCNILWNFCAMTYRELPDGLQRIAWDILCEKEPELC